MDIRKQFSLSGRVAVVTGGAGWAGPVLAEALLEAGARVVLADLDLEKARAAARSLARRARGRVWEHPVDVTSESSVRELFRRTVAKWGRLDVLVNAVMYVGPSFYDPIERYTRENWNRVMDVNAWGVFLCMREAAPYLKKSGKGTVINFGSIYGVVSPDQRIYGKSGINSPAVYAASKAAVISLTRYAAVYWADAGIRVNSISPGGLRNRQSPEFLKNYSARSPQGRMVEREELKGATVYLASDASSSVTGHNLMVDGGWTAW